MAKLSARNRTTLAEVSREYSETTLQARTDKRNALVDTDTAAKIATATTDILAHAAEADAAGLAVR